MLKHLTTEISNKRFVAYVALLYILAFTAGAWVPASSPIFSSAPYVKLALLPIAQAFLLMGASSRWPGHYGVIVAASSAFYGGVILSVITSVFF
ncbi:hypothetical protein [Pseudomonas aeruginosa]|uniref:hypothetical protein n=1 Tax=Pseudomonas aeruginosa TaxID=287 RepID=UPI003D001F4F